MNARPGEFNPDEEKTEDGRSKTGRKELGPSALAGEGLWYHAPMVSVGQGVKAYCKTGG